MPSLRPYQPKDWPHFLALDLETAQDALGDAPESERATLRERWPKVLAEKRRFTPESFADPRAELWILESDTGEYLGHLWLSLKEGPLSGAKLLEVTTMGLVKSQRGKGLGRLLMQKAETAAKEKGIELIELSVAGNNRRARDLYRDLGYETTRRTMRKRLRG